MKPMNLTKNFIVTAVFFSIISMVIIGCSASGQSAEQSVIIDNSKNVASRTSIPTARSESTKIPVIEPQSTSAEIQTDEVSYSKDIFPVIEKSCVSCHGGEKTSKGLDLKTYLSTMAGSQNGQMVMPGNSAGSKLIQSIQSGKMPKRGEKLTTEQVDLLIKWIDNGAKNN